MTALRVPVTLKKLSEASGLSVSTLERAVHAGHLKATNPAVYKDGKGLAKVLVHPDEFERWATTEAQA